MIEQLRTALADRYRIERELGVGGMATVYLAHDPKHDRHVAIKVLLPDLAAALGGERFLSEIKTTAKLQHAHILPLLDSGVAQGFLYYVMPVVTGESLRQQLNREKQLSITDAVRITREVASALDYAHRQGVIHRDIKPENILLHEGQALVADFGIALAVQSSGSQRLTQTGFSLGTPQYMSPEQAMGERTIDARADIYALGAVTYEMLTGEPPFTGATLQAIMAKVISYEPEPPTHTRRTIPPHVEEAVLTALAKLPADRFASAAEYAAALELSGSMRTTTSRPVPTTDAFVRKRTAVALGVVTVVALTTAVWGWTRNTTAAPRPIVKVIIAAPAGVTLPLALGVSIAISRDGSKVVFPGTDSAGTSHIYVRYLDRAEPVMVPVGSAVQPFFSPDGLSVGFNQGGTIKTVVLAGGPIAALCPMNGRGISWGDDGDIIFNNRGSLVRCAPAGGKAEELITPPAGEVYVYPSHIPGTRAVLFGITGDSSGAAVLSLDGRTITRLPVPAINVQYVDPGLLVYGQRGGTVVAVPFDKKTFRVTGPPQRLTDQVLVRNDGTARFAVAQSGTLAHIVNDDDAITELMLVDRQGRTTTLAMGPRRYERPRFSPDGRRIAVGTAALSTDGSDIWMLSLDSRVWQRLTTDSVSYYPEWDVDGQTIVLNRIAPESRTHVRISADGGGAAVPVVRRSRGITNLHILADRRSAVFTEVVNSGASQASRVLLAPIDNFQAATVLLPATVQARALAVSADGQWLAHVSNETGADEVYVSRVQAQGGRVRVSQQGGSEPRFGPNGELYFRARDTVFVSRLEPAATPRFGAAKALFVGNFNRSMSDALWDVSSDGTQFVMVRTTPGTVGSRIGLYLNWTDHWKKSNGR